MARQIYTLQEPDCTILKLHRAGLVQVRDILRLTADQLASEVHISSVEAASLQQRVGRRPALTSGRPRPPPGHVVTFSRRLDALLGGGLPLGQITELVAPPGGGKTQLCLQACVDAALPAELGGLSSDSLFIDTEDSPIAGRLLSMAEAAAEHVRRAALSGDAAERRAAEDFTTETALRRVHILRVTSPNELLLLPSVLGRLLERGRLRLVCVDSIAAPWRSGEQAPRRAQELQWLAGELRRLAAKYGAAVVLTNQATTHFDPPTSAAAAAGSGAAAESAADGADATATAAVANSGASGACLVPALGASWRHCAAIRLWLEPRGHRRSARLTKHPSRPDGAVYFQILGVGVRDVCDGDGDGDGGGDGGETQDTCVSEEEREDTEDTTGGGGAAGDAVISAEHVTKREGEPSGHVTESEGVSRSHVTDQGGDVTTRTERDVTNGTGGKRRRIL